MDLERKLIILQDSFKALSGVNTKLAKISESFDFPKDAHEASLYEDLNAGVLEQKFAVERLISQTIEARKAKTDSY